MHHGFPPCSCHATVGSSFSIGSTLVAPPLFFGSKAILFGVLAYCFFNQWCEVFLEVRGHPFPQSHCDTWSLEQGWERRCGHFSAIMYIVWNKAPFSLPFFPSQFEKMGSDTAQLLSAAFKTVSIQMYILHITTVFVSTTHSWIGFTQPKQ